MNQEQKEREAACCSNDRLSQEIPVQTGCCDTRDRSRETTESHPDSSVLEYRVDGMDCPSCAATIEKSLKKTDGIQSVEVHYATGKMAVGADDAAVHDAIPKQVRKLGFEAAPLQEGKSRETYNVQGMDCGTCAMTIEKHLSSLPDVQDVQVHFSTGKMQIEHVSHPDTIRKEVKKAGFDASLDRGTREHSQEEKKKIRISTTTLSGIFLMLGFAGSFTALPGFLVTVLYAAAVVTGGFKPAKAAFYALKSGSLDMNVLMASAAIGAALIGEWFEGAMVVWLFALGTTLQNRSMERTRASIRSLMDLAPPEAVVLEGGKQVRKAVEEVGIGDVLIVKPGEKIPLDGEVINGSSSVNQAPITGESLPVDKQEGSTVYAGTVNENGSLEIKVTTLAEDTTIAGIIHLVEEAQEKKAPTEAFIDRFAAVYTPVVFALAVSVMVLPPLFGFGTWGEWLYKGLALLVVACPCALVISTPVAIVSAIGNAAKNGVLIKGGTFLEKAGRIEAMAFDKTGTLTEGKPNVIEATALHGSEEGLLAAARTIEEHSTHPIALAVTAYAEERGIPAENGSHFQTMAGKGAAASIDGIDYFAGSPAWFQEMDVFLQEAGQRMQTLQEDGSTLVVVGTRSRVLGIIAVRDTIRAHTAQSIQALKQTGLPETAMLTGDNRGTAKRIAEEAGVDRSFDELLPADKVTAVRALQQEGKRVAMVGDGINDAPALASADLGIAMGGAGTDTAMETADIVLMADNLEQLPRTIRLSRKALAIIKQNIWFSLLTKAAALVLIFPGFLTLWMAVLSDTGAALLVILNSMRLLRTQ
ncbi:heavy metal translocating P-type ATPase [Salibacterium halotolerans]|uniref:Cd(2+)-exporting ATPase n=1 Tax=Salibacterium halotolerans TaxID=1884432 RepID=A0A1I5X5H9_9BACI|nr:heavy metal translocating P-type ATPase [Salibacterium halotolerans]SFQ27249.1 Cd2+/Zn2+-exporting ATPase [Salibacterium halotolerans]